MEKETPILIVEDEVLSAMSLQQDLKRSGYTNSSYVTTGEDALAQLQNDTAGLVIMDISLGGGMSGVETAEVIAADNKIPVILASGYSYADYKDRVEAIENVIFLKKPIRKMELLKILESI